MNKLWYKTPAKEWDEALPLGNGRIGAMVHSGVELEKISLNDDTLWSGYAKDHNKDVCTHYQKTQELAMQGQYKKAQEIIEEHLLGQNSERYLPLGDLIIENNVITPVESYKRELDLETALHKLTYTQDAVEYTRETFVSHPDQSMVMRMSADKGKPINILAYLQSKLDHEIGMDKNSIHLTGVTDANEPKSLKFAVTTHITTDGEVSQTERGICVTNASEVIINLCCRTSYQNNQYRDTLLSDIKNVSSKTYDNLKNSHIQDYQKLYNRVKLNLGNESILSTPERLDNWETSENDPAIFALLFQYGRYLMISGSREGTQPLNLQGIWNPHFYAPWSSNYTMNINTEMNYWPAEITNLAECHKPLIKFMDKLRVTGAKTAKMHYGASGFVAHHNSDMWGMSTPVESVKGGARWAFWPLAGGWLSAHAYSHYQYNLDKAYLRDVAYPIIRDAAIFFLDVLVEDDDKTLIFAPSTSPENDFTFEGEGYSVSKTTTMTTAIIKETLQNLVESAEILGIDMELVAKAKETISRLAPYKIGSRGELLEWSEELVEHEPTHRHTSHLYPLYPGYEIKPDTDLARACIKTLDLRGEESTGWALAWRICLWARLQDGERAFSFLKKQIRPCHGYQGGCYPNMFGSHPPFQIDSNFGATAGIAEMLMQNPKPSTILLLPALPKALQNGYVKGLRAKGGVTVSIWFRDGHLERATFLLDGHLAEADFEVSYEGVTKIIRLKGGEELEL